MNGETRKPTGPKNADKGLPGFLVQLSRCFTGGGCNGPLGCPGRWKFCFSFAMAFLLVGICWIDVLVSNSFFWGESDLLLGFLYQCVKIGRMKPEEGASWCIYIYSFFGWSSILDSGICFLFQLYPEFAQIYMAMYNPINVLIKWVLLFFFTLITCKWSYKPLLIVVPFSIFWRAHPSCLIVKISSSFRKIDPRRWRADSGSEKGQKGACFLCEVTVHQMLVYPKNPWTL